MEPHTSAPEAGIEQTPVQHGPSVEHAPQETLPERGLLEKGEQLHEQASEGAAKASDSSVPIPVFPTTIVTDDPVSDDDQTATLAPIVAADEDLIEKEWVDRAKKIVADNNDDPYKKENAVNQLQRDYQKKRFGRELGEAS